MTEYVATRWYRAPEIMLSFANYVCFSITFLSLDRNLSIFVFLVHCHRRLVSRLHSCRTSWRQADLQRPRVSFSFIIFLAYDMLILLFTSYVDQLNQILHYLGTPSEDTLRRVGSPRVGVFVSQHLSSSHSITGPRLYSIPPDQTSRPLLHPLPPSKPPSHRPAFSDALL